MEKSKIEILREILYEIPSRIVGQVENQQFHTASYFDFEIISLDSNTKDSILFSSLDEAVEVVTELTLNKSELEIREVLTQLLVKNGISENQNFKVKVIH